MAVNRNTRSPLARTGNVNYTRERQLKKPYKFEHDAKPGSKPNAVRTSKTALYLKDQSKEKKSKAANLSTTIGGKFVFGDDNPNRTAVVSRFPIIESDLVRFTIMFK